LWSVLDEHLNRLPGDTGGQLANQVLIVLPQPVGRKGVVGEKFQALPVEPGSPNGLDPGGIAGFAQVLPEFMADITP